MSKTIKSAWLWYVRQWRAMHPTVQVGLGLLVAGSFTYGLLSGNWTHW